MISPPSIEAQNSASGTGSAQSMDTNPLRATAIQRTLASRSACRLLTQVMLGGRPLGRTGPAGEEGQRLVRWRPGLGGVGEERLPGVGGELHRLVREREVPGDAVMHVLRAGG